MSVLQRRSTNILTFGRWRDLLLAALIALGLPWIAAIVVPFAKQIPCDPNGYWLLPTAHQLSTLLLTLVVMRVVSRRSLHDWGFNADGLGLSLEHAAIFAVLFTVPLYILMDSAPAPQGSISPVDRAAVLVTHFFIIGFTQEALFRGFVITYLSTRWPRVLRLGAIEISIAGLWSALIFSLAHVKPSPPYIWPPQILFSLVFGLAYAAMYARTRSLLGASLAHGYSNTIYVAMMMLKFS
jgi:membrane protease YdiL (CAAX protease family)